MAADLFISNDKLNIPSQSFATLIKEIKYESIENSIVKKVQELPQDAIKIKLYTKAGEKDLVICNKYFFISKYQLPAKQQTSGFGAFLNKHLRSKRLNSIDQLDSERVFMLNFGDHFLVLELFSKGNVILTDQSKKVLGCLRTEEWSARKIKKGFQYVEPPSSTLLDKITAEDFVIIAKKDPEAKIIPWLVKSFGLSPLIAEASCLEVCIEKDISIAAIPESELKKLYEKTKLMLSMSDASGRAYVVEHRNSLYLLNFLPKIFASSCIHEFKGLNDALNEIFVMQNNSKIKIMPVNKKAEELQKALEKQIAKIKSCERSALELKDKARTIYENFNDICSAFEFAKAETNSKKGKGQIMYNLTFGNVLLKSIDFSKRSLKIEIHTTENKDNKKERSQSS
ncbi:MAG: NFACT family protein [Candidatus Diapherotrites archaeon]|nr:NFACT family protein [Candidatus Diapherotrites archaeon]